LISNLLLLRTPSWSSARLAVSIAVRERGSAGEVERRYSMAADPFAARALTVAGKVPLAEGRRVRLRLSRIRFE
jgi:hypothetical protein